MNIVQPIRNPAQIDAMKRVLLRQNPRNYFLFLLGINIGLRISDLIPLQVKDLQGSHIVIQEMKTGKQKRFFINNQLRSEINAYTANSAPDDYIFPSQKGRIYQPNTSLQHLKYGCQRSRTSTNRHTYHAENLWLLSLQAL